MQIFLWIQNDSATYMKRRLVFNTYKMNSKKDCRRENKLVTYVDSQILKK